MPVLSSDQISISTRTSNAWNVKQIGELCIATRRLTRGSMTSATTASLGSVTLPDGKNFSQVTLTTHINNDGGYVEYLTVGSQYGATSTANTWYIRNDTGGTTGNLSVDITCIYTL